MQPRLRGIPETLLIPLWARAAESAEIHPIIRDPGAVRMLAEIDYDFARFGSARLSRWGVAVRTLLLDRAAQAFLERHPRACVVNLGCGLDTRHMRLQHRDTLWYELDLPESLMLRRRFFDESPQYRFIARSVFDTAWFDEVNAGNRPLLLIAEGLFMYFEEREIRALFSRMAGHFGGAEMLLEMQGPAIVGNSRRHDALRHMDDPPAFKWGTANDRAPETWHPGIRVLDVWRFFDQYPERMGWGGRLMRLPWLRPRFEPRILRLQFPVKALA
ncbi:MAG: class I SAM-dependent methyltransferase [Brachymonas sp.]